MNPHLIFIKVISLDLILNFIQTLEIFIQTYRPWKFFKFNILLLSFSHLYYIWDIVSWSKTTISQILGNFRN